MSQTNTNKSQRARKPGPPYSRFPGGYRFSGVMASLCELDGGGDVVLSTIRPGAGADSVALFVFLSDGPGIPICWSTYEGVVLVDSNNDTVAIPDYEKFEQILKLGIPSTPMNSIIAAGSLSPATGVDNLGRVRGETPAGVPLAGFMLGAFVKDQALADANPTAIDPYLTVLCLAQGAVQDNIGAGSGLGLQTYEGAGTTPATDAPYPDRTAIILDVADYTTTMRANSNIYEDGGGTLHQIVGLWHQDPAG